MARGPVAPPPSSAVVLFTLAYPYGRGEEFLDGELPHLLAAFDRVVIVPTLQTRGQPQTRKVPDGVIVVAPETVDRRRISTLAVLALRHPRGARRVIGMLIRRLTGDASANDDLQFDVLSTTVALQVRRRLADLVAGIPDVVFYGFWLNVPARVALETRQLLRRRRSAVVSRANGFDLFAERHPTGYLPQQKLILDGVDRVFAASEPAEEYLLDRYPEHASKYSVERIGTSPAINPGNVQRHPVVLVSCSYVSPVKRIPMLIDGLAELQRRGVDLSWIHIGSGEDRIFHDVVSYAQERLTPGTFEFLGHMEPHELRQWYAANPATMFAQLSESEGGLAATIQEALAQGLPVVVTRVGGVAVLGDTDLPLFDGLLDVEHTPQEFAARVQLLLDADDPTYRSYAAAAMSYWFEYCSADRLASGFAGRLRAVAGQGATRE